MLGIQPKNNNNGKAQMFVILLASMCHAINMTFGDDYIIFEKCASDRTSFKEHHI